MLQPRGYHFNCDFWQTHSNSIQKLRSHPMDLEFIMKWIPVVHKIKICELTDCGIMIKLFGYQSVQNMYFSFKISYELWYIWYYCSFQIFNKKNTPLKLSQALTYIFHTKISPRYTIHLRAGGTMKSWLGQTETVSTVSREKFSGCHLIRKK